jgi:hypothetical protein
VKEFVLILLACPLLAPLIAEMVAMDATTFTQVVISMVESFCEAGLQFGDRRIDVSMVDLASDYWD